MTFQDWPEGWEPLTLAAPRRHDDPGQGTLLLKAAVKGASGPWVVFLAGGPGDTPFRMMGEARHREVFEEASRHCRLVLLEQRGCGGSEPGWRLGPLSAPRALAGREEAKEALRVQGREFLDRTPNFDPQVLTPLQSARDLGLLADLAGEPLVLWGYSYGTHLAMAARVLLGEKVRRVAASGFEGLNQTWKHPRIADQTLERLGLRESFMAAQESLAAEPWALADGEELSAFGLRWMAAGWFGMSDQAAKMATRMEACLRRSEDDRALMLKVVQTFRKLQARPLAFYCNDLASGATSDRLEEIGSEGGCFGDDLNFPFPWIREVYPQVDLGDGFRLPSPYPWPEVAGVGTSDGFNPPENLKELNGPPESTDCLLLEGAFHDHLVTALWEARGPRLLLG